MGLLPYNKELMEMKTTTLYRPVGPKEFKLISDSAWTEFPPRLPEQPIFYPVLNLDYARRISKEWNVPAKGVGFVVVFNVSTEYLDQYEIQQVGDNECREYWIPAERLQEFNDNIWGLIQMEELHYGRQESNI